MGAAGNSYSLYCIPVALSYLGPKNVSSNMSSATTSKETRNRFKGVKFNIDIDEVEKQIDQLPQKPSLKRYTDGTYHKLDDKKQYEVSMSL